MRVAVVRRYPGCPAGCAHALPLARHARPDRQRRSGAARVCRRCSFRAPGGPCAPRSSSSRSPESRPLPDPRPATPGREQAGLALPARALAEPAHDLPAGGIGSVGARVCLLARPGIRALLAPWHARGRLSRSRSRSFSCAPVQRRPRCRSVRREQRRQVGAGGAALIASGVGASKALSVAISVGALGIFSGGGDLPLRRALEWRAGALVEAT